jgi:hypothetical protein
MWRWLRRMLWHHVAVKLQRGPSLATNHSSQKSSTRIASRQLHFDSISLAYTSSVSRLRSPSLRFALNRSDHTA